MTRQEGDTCGSLFICVPAGGASSGVGLSRSGEGCQYLSDHPQFVQFPRTTEPRRRFPVTLAIVRHGSETACSEQSSVVLDPSALCAHEQRSVRVLVCVAVFISCSLLVATTALCRLSLSLRSGLTGALRVPGSEGCQLSGVGR